jgi:GTP-binding protein HflX
VLLPTLGQDSRRADLRLEEVVGLAEALDLQVVKSETMTLRRLHPDAYFGAGRIEALKEFAATEHVQVIVVDTALTPVQQRNLERAIEAKVIDRTGLILEIFGRRARTKEGSLQVELARLGYERSRLVRTWTHLERQRGGLSKTGGPGETQIELDRRLIAHRIDKLKDELTEVRRTRGLQRRARRRAGLPAVVLVGYTNAGKSSLFNRLTEAGVLAKNMPFATLDPTARAVRLPSGRSTILSDTVGFITDLPTELVESFRATLEEITAADLLVHVRDISHEETKSQAQDVRDVLHQLMTGAEDPPPVVEAWNKADLLTEDDASALQLRAEREGAYLISSRTGSGIVDLLERVDEAVFGPTRIITVRIDAADGRTPAAIAAVGRILEQRCLDDGETMELTAEMPATMADAFVSPV